MDFAPKLGCTMTGYRLGSEPWHTSDPTHAEIVWVRRDLYQRAATNNHAACLEAEQKKTNDLKPEFG